MADTPAPNSDKPEVNRDDKGGVFSDLYGSNGDQKEEKDPVRDNPMPEDTKYADSKLKVQVEFFKNLKRPFVVSEYSDKFKTYEFSRAFKPEDIDTFEKLVPPFILTDSEFNTFTLGFDFADLKKMERLSKSRNQIDDILKAILPDSVRSPDPSEVIADRIREFASKSPYIQEFGRVNRPLESGKLYRRLKANADRDSIGSVMPRPNKPNEQFVEIVVGPRVLFGALAVLGLYTAYKFGKAAPR